MPINIVLHDNHLTPDPNDFMATVQYNGTIDQDTLLKRMKDFGLIISEKDAEATLNSYYNAMFSYILEGFKVVTPHLIMGVSVKGVFDSADDSYDPIRHTVELQTRPGVASRKQISENVQINKRQTKLPLPDLLSFVDRRSGTTNATATPGGQCRITGSNLKFDEADPTQGIFFIAADKTETRVDPLDMGQHNPALLIFTIPATLAAGQYTVQVRSAFGANVRAGTLPKPVTVLTAPP